MRLHLRHLAAAFVLAACAAGSAAQDALRPEVGRPLQAAGELVKAGRYRDALAKVREADAVAAKTPAEQATVDRMRLSAALGAGDPDTAAAAVERLVAAGRVDEAEKLRLSEALAGAYYRAGQAAKAQAWAQRHLKDGGTSAAMRSLVAQAQADGGDFAGVARQLAADVAADEKAGRTPPEDRLRQLAYAQQKSGDEAGYGATLEKLAARYPRPDYWRELIGRLQRRPGLADRLGVDVLRLKLATGTMAGADDYLELAQLAIQARSAREARAVVEQGYAAGVLGTGPQAERHQRLVRLVERSIADEARDEPQALEAARSARDGNALVDLGFRRAMGGQAADGVVLIEQGIARGGLKRPDDARLRLGLAQLRAGQKAAAQKTLRSVSGSDGSADLARLWALQAG